MNGVPDIVSTLLEVSVTLAGFSGLVFVFRRDGEISEALSVRIASIWMYCLLAAVTAILPHILFLSSIDPTIVVGAPLLFMSISHVAILCLAFYRRYNGELVFTTRFTEGLSILSLFIFLTLILAAFDLLLPRTYGMLVFGLGWTLFLATSAFAMAVIRAQEGGT